jgi:hypothetical protein
VLNADHGANKRLVPLAENAMHSTNESQRQIEEIILKL